MEVPLINAFDAWFLLDQTKFLISRLRDIELSELGVTPEQAAILRILAHGKATIASIEESWMRKPQSISALITRMTKQGLVRKKKYPKKKIIEISLTEKGMSVHDELTLKSLDMVFSALSQDDLQKFSQYLKLLYIRSRGLLGIKSPSPLLL